MKALSSGQFWALVLTGWFFASLATGLLLGKIFKTFNGSEDPT